MDHCMELLMAEHILVTGEDFRGVPPTYPTPNHHSHQLSLGGDSILVVRGMRKGVKGKPHGRKPLLERDLGIGEANTSGVGCQAVYDASSDRTNPEDIESSTGHICNSACVTSVVDGLQV